MGSVLFCPWKYSNYEMWLNTQWHFFEDNQCFLSQQVPNTDSFFIRYSRLFLLPLSFSGFCLVEPIQVLCVLSQFLLSHACMSPLVSERHGFLFCYFFFESFPTSGSQNLSADSASEITVSWGKDDNKNISFRAECTTVHII